MVDVWVDGYKWLVLSLLHYAGLFRLFAYAVHRGYQ